MTRSAVPLAYFILLLFDSGDEIAGDREFKLATFARRGLVRGHRRASHDRRDHFQQR